MVAGRRCPTTAMFGFPTNPRPGFLIVPAPGPMSTTMTGRGLATSLGDGRRTTMAAGSPTAAHGPGGRGRVMPVASTVPSRRLHTYRSLAGAVALASEWAMAGGAASAGFRLGLATISIPGGADTADDLA